MHACRSTLEDPTDTVFASVNLASQIEGDGTVTVESLVPGMVRVPAAAGSRITAVNGKTLPTGADVDATVAAIEAGGPAPRLALRDSAGTIRESATIRSPRYAERARAGEIIGRDARIATRLAISLATCAVIIACAVLLVTRRPRDPVCQMFSFSFLLFAGTIDPPLVMWMGLGLGEWLDLFSTTGWMLLVVGIAVFPDGRFEPRAMRWVLLAVPLGAIFLSIDGMPMLVQALVGFVLPLALLWGTAVKYRRFGPGVERQQIKWAAMGFAGGLLSVAAAFAMVALDPFPVGRFRSIYALSILVFFDLGFMLLALGLMVALLRFRLWEADRVLGRSAIMAGVALVIGIVWAASVDLVKNAIELALGEENQTFASALCAILAAGLFAPLQNFVVKRTRNRFDRDSTKVRALIGRLAGWRATEDPGDIAARTLSALERTIHFSSAAVIVDTRLGRELLAARDIAEPELLERPGADPAHDPRFVWHLPLEDEDGQVGLLLIGPRSDANRYNEDERANCERVLEPLAETLRVALKRRDQDGHMRRLIGSVEARLARLEGGGNPAPA